MTTCTSRAAWLNLLHRLHFYIRLFIGPFIFVAALTGTLYVATPQLENRLYHDVLHGLADETPQPLSAQTVVAEEATQGSPRLLAVRPAPAMGETTRIMFVDPSLDEPESRVVFVDPTSLRVRGDMTVYGTSGILPLRQWIDYAHRSLLPGDNGRSYSELAASWMWVVTLGGIALQAMIRPKRRINNVLQNHRRLHVMPGRGLLLGMLFFFATDLTWSQWAGDNVSRMRAAFGWWTPQVNTLLYGEASMAHDPRAGRHMDGMAMQHQSVLQPVQFDLMLVVARQAELNASRPETRLPVLKERAWTVNEIDRRRPTQADVVVIDSVTMQVVDCTRSADFPLMAKLTRWGVDFHTGVPLGLVNQLLLVGFGCVLCATIGVDYRLWWIRRPPQTVQDPARSLLQAWLSLAWLARGLILGIVLALSLAMLLMGASLVLFIAVDYLRWYVAAAMRMVKSSD